MRTILLVLLGVLFIGVPFVYFPAFTDPFELPKVAFFLVLVIITLGLSKCCIITPRTSYVKRGKLRTSLVLFYATLALSSVLNHDVHRSIFGQYYRYHGLITIIALIGFAYFISMVPWRMHRRIHVFVGISGLLVTVMIVVQYILVQFGLPIYTFHGRMTALLGNPNFAAGYVVLASIPAYDIVRRTYGRTASISTWLVIVGAVVLTASRTGMLLILLPTLYLVPRSARLIVSVVGVLAAIVIVGSISQQRVSSFDTRPAIWRHALSAIAEKPLKGWGVERFEYAFQSQLSDRDGDLKNIRVDKAHNESLEIAVAGGVMAVLLWWNIVYTVCTILLKHYKRAEVRPYVWYSVLFLLYTSVNIASITLYILWYACIGMAYALERRG